MEDGVGLTLKQDNVTCEANQRCRLVNFTFLQGGNIWKAINVTGWLFVQYLQDTDVITLLNATFIKCNLNDSCMITVRIGYDCLSETNIFNTSIKLYTSNTLYCMNGTQIKNRTIWVNYITILKNHAGVKHNSIVKVPSTCIPVAQQYQKKIIHFNITFPPNKTCRKKILV